MKCVIVLFVGGAQNQLSLSLSLSFIYITIIYLLVSAFCYLGLFPDFEYFCDSPDVFKVLYLVTH